MIFGTGVLLLDHLSSNLVIIQRFWSRLGRIHPQGTQYCTEFSPRSLPKYKLRFTISDGHHLKEDVLRFLIIVIDLLNLEMARNTHMTRSFTTFKKTYS